MDGSRNAAKSAIKKCPNAYGVWDILCNYDRPVLSDDGLPDLAADELEVDAGCQRTAIGDFPSVERIKTRFAIQEARRIDGNGNGLLPRHRMVDSQALTSPAVEHRDVA